MNKQARAKQTVVDTIGSVSPIMRAQHSRMAILSESWHKQFTYSSKTVQRRYMPVHNTEGQ